MKGMKGIKKNKASKFTENQIARAWDRPSQNPVRSTDAHSVPLTYIPFIPFIPVEDLVALIIELVKHTNPGGQEV